MGVVDGVHGDTTGLGPVVLLGLGLVEGASSLEHGLVDTSSSGDDTDGGAGKRALNKFLAPVGKHVADGKGGLLSAEDEVAGRTDLSTPSLLSHRTCCHHVLDLFPWTR